MADLLTDEERTALKDSIQSTGRSRERAPARHPEPTPVALIADDRVTEKLRPAALRIVERWIPLLQRFIDRASGAKVEVTVDEGGNDDPHEIIDELAHNWLGMVKPVRGRNTALVAVSGPMIPELAARVLGGKYDKETGKPPTAATMRVFGKIGEQIILGLSRAMEQEQGDAPRIMAPPQSAETWQPIVDETPLVVVRLSISGDATGVIRFVAPPDVIAAPPRGTAASRTDPALIRTVLGDVPVELSVVLGTITMRATEFADLQPGAVLKLESLIGDPLAVRVAGRLHAFGHAVLEGDIIAVEIGSANHGARR